MYRVFRVVDVNDNRPRPRGVLRLGAPRARPHLHIVVIVVDATFVVLLLCHKEGLWRKPIPGMWDRLLPGHLHRAVAQGSPPNDLADG
jgi:hypothetical protein